MNPSDKKGVCVEISIGDFFDRYAIDRVRIDKLSLQADSPWALQTNHQANLLLQTLGAHTGLVEQLKEIHRELWELEVRIRSIATDSAFFEVGKRIFALNDERHRLKAEIDRLIPTRCAVRRTY